MRWVQGSAEPLKNSNQLDRAVDNEEAINPERPGRFGLAHEAAPEEVSA